MKSIQDLNRLSPEKRKEAIADMRDKCACPSCPTYTECAADRKETTFCFYGKSLDCITREISCKCPKCSVHNEYGFRKKYYCTKGGESTAPKRL